MEKSKEEMLGQTFYADAYTENVEVTTKHNALRAMQEYADQETSKLKEDNKRLMEELEIGKQLVNDIWDNPNIYFGDVS